jgi:hypothetical protein
MSLKTKAILINCSVIVALVYKYWTGTPFFIIAITGIFLLVLANLLMIFAAKKRTDATD